MNVLAIDIGNTRLKWAAHDGVSWTHQGRMSTGDVGMLGAALATVPVPRHAVISNVAGKGVQPDVARALAPLGAAVEWIVPCARQCDVVSGYAEPETLGPDRWAALIAARNRYRGNCMVVCAGTTVTIDALSHDGVFIGGCIVAGFNLMRGAIAREAARLEMQPGNFSYFPDRTTDAIWSGTLNAVCGAIERMAGYMTRAGDEPGSIFVSGGDAAVIAAQLTGPVEVVDNLVLDGLLCIARDRAGPGNANNQTTDDTP